MEFSEIKGKHVDSETVSVSKDEFKSLCDSIRIEKLLNEWHEAGREEFTSHYENLDYDRDQAKRAVDKKKYVCLDIASGSASWSGAFILDKETGIIYRLKSTYGVPNKKKVVGKLGEITGKRLWACRWW